MATIYDVAKQAGVSPKTVSRVINAEPNVRESTKAAVQDAIARLDYRPSTAARLMKSQRSNVIGFLTDRVVTSPEAIDIASGVAAAAEAAGLTVLFVTNGEAASPMQGRGFDSLIDLNVDGLIYASQKLTQVETRRVETLVPTVLVNCFNHSGSITSVIPDDEFGGYEAGRMLIDAGHRNVTMLNLDSPALAAPLRSGGFRRAFIEAGLTEPTIVTALGDNAGTWEEHEDLPQILDNVLANNPTALFCGNDKMAMVVYGLLANRGIKVPSDISVVGYDDYQLITRLLRPQLSSVSIAYDEIGRRAVRELQMLIETDQASLPSHKATQIKVAGEGMIRGSIQNV